ncbi:hypothetical protein O181_091191 [Austropuccinia psidii MF-1]|uniref:Uncharacterized protein n=1 Tax=Austropuccinia psidii MF-1 TaxID=1389203 RepID=A0A9Q3IX13_9BASI|nr:hypothetical protein [Austropuccinia psidii MF-1]
MSIHLRPQELICHLYTSETLASRGTNQRTDKSCPEPEDLQEDTLDTVVDGKSLREIIPTLPFTFQFNRKLKSEDREILSRTRRPGRGHLGHSGGWQNTEGNHTHPAIHFPIQQEAQTRGLERYRSSSSAPPFPQRFLSMEHGQQEVQPDISLGRTWIKLPEDLSQRDRLQRPHDNHQRLESYQAVQTPGGEGKQDKGKSSHYPSYRRTTDPDSAY